VDPRRRLQNFSKAVLANLLSWCAGFVDAVGWLFVYHVYISHMTGNTASFGISAAQGNWTEAAHHAWPILPFVAGTIFTAFSTAAARRRNLHSSFSIALTVELALVLVFLFEGSRGGSDRLRIALLAAAMGIQTVTVTRVAGLRIYTTYLTGSLSKFAEAVVEYGFWFRDRTRGRLRQRLGKVLRVTPRQTYMQHALLTASLWATFFAGAFSGAKLRGSIGYKSLALPAVILAFAIVVDIVRPVAAADEPRAWDDL
jgi:uncharacterized membrane protein YoaK (UPF0700 family)